MSDSYSNQIVKPGDKFSELARRICIGSFQNSPAITVRSGGSGMRAMDGFTWNKPTLQAMLDNKVYEVAQSDGAGGKPQFFTLFNNPEVFRGLGWEIITMNADDAACRGGLATMILSSNLDIKQITEENWHLCEALLLGFGDALRQSNLVLMTGETAVMPHCITAFCDSDSAEQLILTWNATCLGLASEDKKPNGSSIKPDMVIIGFKDKGYRCNGGTKFTNIILDTWGDQYENEPEARAFVKKIVVPSRSYANTISRLNGWKLDGSLGDPIANLHGVAHITGGGIWSKLGEILPKGVGADLALMPRPTSVLLEAQRLAEKTGNPMSDFECHGTFHGGCGLMVVCEQKDVNVILREAEADGHDPYVIGDTTRSNKNEITIVSKFLNGGLLYSLNPN